MDMEETMKLSNSGASDNVYPNINPFHKLNPKY